MAETKEKRTRIYFSPETWHEVKQKACGGVGFTLLAKDYGMSRQSIRNRAVKERWPIPRALKADRETREEVERLRREVAAAKSESETLPPPYGSNTRNKLAIVTDIQTKPSCISKFHAALLDLVSSPPADFQTAFAAVAQSAIAEGIRDVPAPRSIKELATWFDLWRKATGLDAKAGTPGNSPLVNPLRTVSRRTGPVVEVDEVAPVPDSPVPGSDEWNGWEV